MAFFRKIAFGLTIITFRIRDMFASPENIVKESGIKGVLSFSDHHMKDEEILGKISEHGLFRLLWKGDKTYNFVKVN